MELGGPLTVDSESLVCTPSLQNHLGSIWSTESGSLWGRPKKLNVSQVPQMMLILIKV